MTLFIVGRSSTGFTVRSGENTLQAAASALKAEAWAEGTLPGGAGTKSAKEWAGDAAVSASASAASANYYSTIAAGIAGTSVGGAFSSAEGGPLKLYERTATSPFYTEIGELDGTLRTDLAAATGAGLVGVVGGGTVQDAVTATISLPHAQRFLQKIANGNEDVNVVLLGDSTGDASNEWFYLLVQALAADYTTHTFKYATWNTGTGAYNTESTVTTGTGARVVKFWNASVAGSVASYHGGDNFNAAVEQVNPDLVFLSYGHNGGTSGIRQIGYFIGIAAPLNTHLPDVPVVLIGQNPTLSDETMADKVNVLRGFAARQGYGFVDVHSAFKQAGVALSTLLADSVHPNATGSALWKDTVYGALFSVRQGIGGATTSPGAIIATYSTIAEFSRWITANVTLSKNTTNWETAGHSTNIACTSPGLAYIYTNALGSDDITALRGSYVTVHARIRVASGNPATTGRMDLMDSVGTTTVVGVTQGNGFISFSCTRRIDDAATYLRIYLYPSAETGLSGTYQVDRLTLSFGAAPVDHVPEPGKAIRRLFLTGAQANGLGVLHNTSGTSVGLRYVPSETADPSTAWTSDFRQDGFAVKQTGDAHARVDVRQDGVYFGNGTTAAPFRIAYRLADGAGINANWYPNSNATHDIGGAGIAWRDLFMTGNLYIGSSQVLGTRKTGWSAATGTATRTAFATSTATTAEVAERLKALIDDLISHGVIGA